MTDYYALLNLPASAAENEIKKALHREMRQWTNRTNAPQIERRQEAERRVKLLEQAESTLLDAAKRAQYDRELGGGGAATHTAPEFDLSGVSNLIDEARRLLGNDRVADALFVARKAVDAEPQNPEAWLVLGTAFSSDGEAEKAIGAYKRAIDLRPNVAGYHFELGSIFESAEQWRDALRCYERAYKIDASVLMYRAAYGVVLVKMGDPTQGISILEQCVQQEPQNAAYQWFLAIAYRESAYLGWTYVAEGQSVGLLEIPGHYATSIDHVTLAQDALTKALALKFDDSALAEELTQLKKDVDSNTKRKFMGNWFVGGAVAALGFFMGKEGVFLFCSGALYLGVSFVPWYVINNQLAKGNTFNDFGWISETFNKGDNNLIMMGIGLFLMILATPIFAVYNLYRYHGDAIRRLVTSSENKERLAALRAKVEETTKKAAGAASGAWSNLSSRDKGEEVPLAGAEAVVPDATTAPAQSNSTSPTTGTDAESARPPAGASAKAPLSSPLSEGGLKGAFDAVKSRVPQEMQTALVRKAKGHVKSFIISKLVVLGVLGLVAVAAIVLVFRQFMSKPDAPAADATRVTNAEPTRTQNRNVALLTAKLSAAEQCLTRSDLVCATSNVDEVVKLDSQNVTAAGMRQRIAALAKSQQDALAQAQAQQAAAQVQAQQAQQALAQAQAQQAQSQPQTPQVSAPPFVQQQPAQPQPQPLQATANAGAPTVAGPLAAMAQDARNGCRVWKPSLLQSDQVVWSGQCAVGLASGQGLATWSTDGKVALTYEGTFREGLLQGRGKMTAAGGDRYDGEYLDGKRDGRGAYIASTGERYEGEFKDNRREGRGVVTRPDGRRIYGLFKDGKLIAESAPPAPDANAALDKAAREAKAKSQAEQQRVAEAERLRLAQDEQRRRAAAQRPAPPAPVAAPSSATSPPPAEPVVAARSVKEACSSRNLISEQLCRTRECFIKPEFANDPICVSYRESQKR